jgi:type IV secretory pathway TrbD component
MGMRRRKRGGLSIGLSLVLRSLLLANGVLLLVLGGLATAYVNHPPGYVVGIALWLVAIGLFSLMPLTDPYRHERRHGGW